MNSLFPCAVCRDPNKLMRVTISEVGAESLCMNQYSAFAGFCRPCYALLVGNVYKKSINTCAICGFLLGLLGYEFAYRIIVTWGDSRMDNNTSHICSPCFKEISGSEFINKYLISPVVT